jgi:uncharacterized protein YbjT (DUF2867 family)
VGREKRRGRNREGLIAVSRVLVAGASGRVGSRLATLLAAHGHEVVRVSRSTGVDTVSGRGLDESMRGVRTMVDATNLVSRDAGEARRFFETSTGNLVAAARRAGVTHHIVLSVVGADRMGSAYMRAKVAQERLVMEAGIPFTVARATQFFEFVATFADAFAVNGEVRVPDARMQPIAIDDVAAGLAMLAVGPPANGLFDIAGPRPFSIRDAVARIARARGDHRTVIASREVLYFGAPLEDDTLLPGAGGGRGTLDLEEWLTRNG